MPVEPIQRIVVRDKHPVFEPRYLAQPFNRWVLGLAGLSLLVQLVGLIQGLVGQGEKVGWFDHASFAIVAFLWLLLGLMVFLQRRAGLAGRLFLLFAASGSAFLAVGTLWYVSYPDAFIYALGLLFFPPLLLSFVRAFRDGQRWHQAELLLYLPAVILVIPVTHDFATRRATSPSFKVALLFVAIYLVGAAVQALRDLSFSRTPEEAAQTRALLFGLLAGTVPAVAALIEPLATTGTVKSINISWMPPIVLLFLIAMSYSVLLSEFSEGDLIVRRGVVYGALTLAIVVAYGVLGEVLATSHASVTSLSGGLGFVAVTVLIGAAFTPITYLARRLVDWVLYGRKVDRWALLQALSARLSIVMQPDEFGDVLVHEITDALHLRGAFLLRKTESGQFAVANTAQAAPFPTRMPAIPTDLVLEATIVERALSMPARPLLLVHSKPLTAAKREEVPERCRVLDSLRAALSIPLVTRSGLEAVLCLQPKLAHDAFDSDDLELLTPVMRQATAALDNALLFSRLQEKVGELRMAYVRIAHEQEAERGRLARELHDGTAQELAGLITLATVAERQLTTDGDAALTTLDRIRRQAEDAYQGVRRAIHALRPLMLDDFGLAPTLARYLQGFQEATGITVEYMVDGVGDLPDDVELALFRVAQECMENVRKHSGATEARLSLQRQNGHVKLSVADSGRGIPDQRERGIGLAGMRERVQAVGGIIQVGGAANGGVQVEASIPVDGP
jgi:signal transduction histidine kinase